MSPANPLADLVDGWILGGQKFVEECRKQAEMFRGQLHLNAEVTADDIAVAVARAFEVDVAQLAMVDRHRNVAREAAIMLARELTSIPLETIAARSGNVTRSAVVETVRRAQEREEANAAFRDCLERVRRELRQ